MHLWLAWLDKVRQSLSRRVCDRGGYLRKCPEFKLLSEAIVGNVVYIDDEKTLCRVFERIMRRFGVTAVTFEDPVQALDHIRQADDVVAIACDYRMPGMTGMQVLDELTPCEKPFFIVSGDHTLNATLVTDPRLAGVLNKPFSRDTLQQSFGQFAN